MQIADCLGSREGRTAWWSIRGLAGGRNVAADRAAAAEREAV